ncbi:MAG: tRNA (cytosine(32)/uridine(32)-2'-O)-methyltransferase TrmJ [Methylophilales bacterium RIFCSPHIGHO2_02_FULL_57_10]|nr:MAG: tRNA (cytosine(32)/uridine(32)-2'-O)-methyltransferase TrmJ [Methylophilales bacterium RIFCSPHIGHO2_02_FULL_57_10]
MNKLDHIRIVLCQTSHPGNIGAAARAMKTMGLSRLYLVRPRKFPHAESYAMASGATDVLENIVVCETLEQALQGCSLVIGLTARKRELSHDAISPREAAAEALVIATSQEAALVFGGETSGLSNEELILCQRLAHIPANPKYSSLNLAAAVQVLAYELYMAAEAPQAAVKRLQLATHDEVEGFYIHLEQTLIDIGFLDPALPKRLMSRLRRLFTRARLQKEEVNILRGILKSISKK